MPIWVRRLSRALSSAWVSAPSGPSCDPAAALDTVDVFAAAAVVGGAEPLALGRLLSRGLLFLFFDHRHGRELLGLSRFALLRSLGRRWTIRGGGGLLCANRHRLQEYDERQHQRCERAHADTRALRCGRGGARGASAARRASMTSWGGKKARRYARSPARGGARARKWTVWLSAWVPVDGWGSTVSAAAAGMTSAAGAGMTNEPAMAMVQQVEQRVSSSS